MTLRSIQLSATESNWRLFMTRKADPAFLSFQNKVFSRDKDTCQYCGFCAKTYQEVINVDGNYTNNRLDNMVTACIFCAQCFFLEAVGKSDFGGGNLVYLPEMTQTELNALLHVLFIAIVSGGGSSTQAKNIYRSLRLRSQPVEKELGEGLSNPALYGQLLIEAKNEEVDSLHNQLQEKLRLLPSLNKFSQQIEAWAKTGLQALRY